MLHVEPASTIYRTALQIIVVFSLLPACFPGVKEPGARGRNVLVHYEPGRFAGWPANSGVWIWGDEIVVGFMKGYYTAQADEHSLDKTRPAVTALARSLDGGETWAVEEHPELAGKDTVRLDDPIDFEHPGFAMRSNDNRFHVSYDRGKSWKGPYEYPDFGLQCSSEFVDEVNCPITETWLTL